MGEITEALRRAKLGEETQGFFRDSTGEDSKHPNFDRDFDEPPIDASQEDYSRTEPAAADLQQDRENARVEIPRTMTGFWIPRSVILEPPLREADCFRNLAVKVNRELDQRNQNSVLVTSALPEEGKTTVSCNLALAISSISGGRRTALVDLDLHRSSVTRVMGVVPKIGFEDVLSGEVPLQAARVPTNIPGFDIYPVATPLHHTTKKAYELLAGPHFQTALRLLSKNYDRVVFDGPPALLVPDVAVIAEHLQACIVVTRQGVTKRSSYLEILSIIPEEKFIGVFLNEAATNRRPRYEYYFEDAEASE